MISDGAGTILTTEQCLLSPNRNPSLSRDAIEELLAEHLGAERIVWLGQGLVEDRDTDGHVDLIAAFTPDRRALVQTVPAGNPNHENCAENVQRLHEAGIETIEVPHLPYREVAGEQVAVGYLNLYICNGAVIVPTAERRVRRGGGGDHRRRLPRTFGGAGAGCDDRIRRWRAPLHHPAGAGNLRRCQRHE